MILLDELSMGLAPLVVHDLYQRVAEIAATGVTVVVVEQFVRTVADIVDHAVALVGGEILLEGSIAEITPQLHSAYFASSQETSR